MSTSRTKANKATPAKLIIPHDIHQKILYYMSKSENEVSGFGSLEHDKKDNTYTVKDIILLKQKVTRASTELDPTAIGKAMYQMRDEPLGLKWHWHTHPNMGVFWSMDDMEVIRSLGQRGWILASVFNEKHEVRSAFYTTTDLMGEKHDIFEDNLETEIISFYPTEFFTQLDKEFDACVTKEVYAPSYGGFYDDGDGDWLHGRYGRVIDATKTPKLPGNGEQRWSPPSSIKYDVDGYGVSPGGNRIYNPLHDKQLASLEEKYMMLSEMAEWEINYLKFNDTAFSAFYRGYLLDLASAREDKELENAVQK